MTNQERADKLAVDSRKVSISCAKLAVLIERALDEAEIRGINSHRDATKEMIGSAYRDGQRDMREKAKGLEEALESISKNTCCDTCQEAKLVSEKALSEWRKVK